MGGGGWGGLGGGGGFGISCVNAPAALVMSTFDAVPFAKGGEYAICSLKGPPV